MLRETIKYQQSLNFFPSVKCLREYLSDRRVCLRSSITGIKQEVLTFPVMEDEAGNDDEKDQLHAEICLK